MTAIDFIERIERALCNGRRVVAKGDGRFDADDECRHRCRFDRGPESLERGERTQKFVPAAEGAQRLSPSEAEAKARDLEGAICTRSFIVDEGEMAGGVAVDESPKLRLRRGGQAAIDVDLCNVMTQSDEDFEGIVLAGAGIYLGVRYGLTWLLENHSVHRGMLHSLPAAVVAGQVAFLAFGAEDPVHRYFIASAVIIGFLTHLVLDEIWSVTQGHFGPKHKTGFGTAPKCWGKEAWSNLLAYVLVVALGVLAAVDAHWSERTLPQRRFARQQMEQAARSMQTPAPWDYRR